jgi:gliding motility-associated-like protein
LLYGSGNGISYAWSPASLVQNPTSLITTAYPKDTTTFTLSVYDTLGCPKAGTSTVLVSVVPAVQVFAGNDTSIVINQPLVFQSTASSFATVFSWSPATGLNSTSILQPTAILTNALLNGAFSITYTLTASTVQGCTASANVTVKIFKTLPSIFVPSAFTPNGDGKNDIIKPILAGISQLQFFRVYNRYGQLVFETSTINKGWDGRINGELQGTATYVYDAQALDYNNQPVKQSGTFVLIR